MAKKGVKSTAKIVTRKIAKVEDYGEDEKKITFEDGIVEIMSSEDFKSSIYSK